MTKMYLTEHNKNINKSLKRKEQFIDDCIVVGYLDLPSIFLVLSIIYGISYDVAIMTILGLIFAIPLIVFNIILQFSIAPKYRLKLQNKYRNTYYEERYDLSGSLQKLHSQTFKIKTFLSRPYSRTCLIDLYIDKLPEKIVNRLHLSILFITSKSEKTVNHNGIDYVVMYSVEGSVHSIDSVQENLDEIRKQEIFGKFYSYIVIEAYINRILSEYSKKSIIISIYIYEQHYWFTIANVLHVC